MLLGFETRARQVPNFALFCPTPVKIRGGVSKMSDSESIFGATLLTVCRSAVEKCLYYYCVILMFDVGYCMTC